MTKVYTMIDIDNIFCLKMKNSAYWIFHRPEIGKCVFYRPVCNSGCTSGIMLKLNSMIDISNSFCLKMKIIQVLHILLTRIA